MSPSVKDSKESQQMPSGTSAVSPPQKTPQTQKHHTKKTNNQTTTKKPTLKASFTQHII